jgi:hypothetical protein
MTKLEKEKLYESSSIESFRILDILNEIMLDDDLTQPILIHHNAVGYSIYLVSKNISSSKSVTQCLTNIMDINLMKSWVKSIIESHR